MDWIGGGVEGREDEGSGGHLGLWPERLVGGSAIS